MDKYFLTILGLIFVTLKLCHVIGWSWWFVTLPFWGLAALAVLIVLLAGVATYKNRSLG